MEIKQKKGISLIVLVITIIVMIVLAAAIILSLQSSGIIGRANEAKAASDIANKKQAATIAMSEYELLTEAGEISTETSATDYIQEKLKSQGLNGDDVAVTNEGEILVGLSKAAVKAVKANIKLGTEIINYNNYLTDKISTPTDGKEHSGTNGQGEKVTGVAQTLKANMNLTWRYIGIDENGNAIISADVPEEDISDSMIELGYEGGYMNGPSTLNTICKQLYSSSMGTARNINISDIIEVLDYKGPVGRYTTPGNELIKIYKDVTIGEIAEELNTTLTNTRTPDGKSIYDYNVKFRHISNNDNDISNEFGKSLIFYNKEYWIADTCNGVNFKSGYAGFMVYFSSRTDVTGRALLNSGVSGTAQTRYIRPVVELDDKVEFKYYESSSKCELI